MTTPTSSGKLGAEALGTFFLVFAGIGSAILAGKTIGAMGVAIAVGLTVLTMIYAVGHISGGHFNPAVTVGLAAGKRFGWSEVPAYVAAQVVGGFVGALGIFAIGAGQDGFSRKVSFAGGSNGWGDVIGGYSLLSVAITEILFTALFVLVILGATSKNAVPGFAGIAIGLALTVIHLATIPIDNTSVNPARSIATAVIAGGDSLQQVWLFIVAPIIGGLIAGLSYSTLTGDKG
ncbi:MAG: aquaporin Z [Aeromicrobium sp.]